MINKDTYKRLTAKKEDRYWEQEEFWQSAQEPSYEEIEELYSRLAELEDKIMDGTLVELKFRLGDTVWFYGFRDKAIYKGKVMGINFNAYTPRNPIWVKIQYDIPMVKRDCDTEVWESMVFTTESEAEAKLKELQEGEEMKANGIDIYKDKRFNPYIAQDDFDCGYHEYAKEQHKKRVAENPDRIAFAIKQFENNNIEYTLKNEATGHFHCRRKSDDKLFQFYAGTGKIVGVSNKRGIHEFIRILTD